MRPLRRIFRDLSSDPLVHLSAAALACFAAVAYATSMSRAGMSRGSLAILGLFCLLIAGIVSRGRRIIRRTERRLIEANEEIARSEERYRGTVENISDVVYRLEADRDWKISCVNSRIEDMIGTPPPEAIGRSILSFVAPDDRPELERVLLALREGVSESVEVPIRMVSADGGTVHQIHRVSRGVGADGRLIGFVGIGVDITGRVGLEERLRRRETLLDMLNEVTTVALAADAPARPFSGVLSRICGFLGFEAGVVVLLPGGADVPAVLGCASRAPVLAADSFVSAFRETMRGEVFSRLRARGGMIAEDLAAREETRALSEATGLRAAAILPLASIPGATGLFVLGSAAPRSVSQETAGMIVTLGDQIALAVRVGVCGPPDAAP